MENWNNKIYILKKSNEFCRLPTQFKLGNWAIIYSFSKYRPDRRAIQI